MNQEAIGRLFKANNIKNTKHRLNVYSYLLSCKQPVTADSIYLDLVRDSRNQENLNQSTVYRILDTFLKHQMIVKTTLGNDSRATFEIKHHEHRHHLICVSCNQITPISGCPLKGYEKMLSETSQFKILEHKLEIFGVCPKCQK